VDWPEPECLAYLFTNTDGNNDGPINVKQQYRSRIECTVWRNNEFKALKDETVPHNGLRTHSEQKFVSDKALKLGIYDDLIEYHGRWVGKRNKKVVRKHYISVENKYIVDAYICTALCDGGTIKYQAKEGLVITDEFLFTHVVPNIWWRKQTDDQFCRVMGLARL
jgi:hypothetical protein